MVFINGPINDENQNWKLGVVKDKMKTVFFLFCFGLLTLEIAAQSIEVRGKVFGKIDSSVTPSAIIINKRIGTGLNCMPGMPFSMVGLKTDTFLITAGGYEVLRICFRDSIFKTIYFIKIGLQMKPKMLSVVAIYPIRDLKEINAQRATIGKVQTRQTIGVVDAMQSPITYLYERFSKDGKSRELVSILENQDNVEAILKELFVLYTSAGVITLDENEYANFIRYLNISESFLRDSSDYDLAVYVRFHYLLFQNAKKTHNRNQR